MDQPLQMPLVDGGVGSHPHGSKLEAQESFAQKAHALLLEQNRTRRNDPYEQPNDHRHWNQQGERYQNQTDIQNTLREGNPASTGTRPFLGMRLIKLEKRIHFAGNKP
jgi:hypothetical protein